MMTRRNLRRDFNIQQLDDVAQGQQARTVLEGTHKIYIAKCKVMTKILNDIPDVRNEALIFGSDGNPSEHKGSAKGVFKLILPILPNTAKMLFAAISIDGSLPRKRRRTVSEMTFLDNNQSNQDMGEIANRLNPAQNIQTVTAQTYQNYKSALKWWHEHHDVEGRDKEGHPWPLEVDRIINQQIRSYKRDVGIKKRKGVMSQKEGKSPYNVTGYVAFCEYFNRMRPVGHSFTWMEGIFRNYLQNRH